MEQKEIDSILTKANEMVKGIKPAPAANADEVERFMGTAFTAMGSVNGGALTKTFTAKPADLSPDTLAKVWQYGWQRIHNDTSNDDLLKVVAKHVALMTGVAVTRGGGKRQEGWERVAIEKLAPLMSAEVKKDATKRSAFIRENLPKLEEWAKAEYARRQEAESGLDDVIAGIVG